MSTAPSVFDDYFKLEKVKLPLRLRAQNEPSAAGSTQENDQRLSSIDRDKTSVSFNLLL
jgi:hypothetical protein